MLSNHPAVAECAVIVGGAGEEMRLAAFVSLQKSSDGHDGVEAILARHLRQWLPSYMLPATITILDRLPQTRTGKIDRAGLQAPDAKLLPENLQVPVAGPRNETERIVASLWTSLLGVARPGVHDNYFETGGHSLLAARLFARIRNVLNVDLPLRTIFHHPTIAGLARQIQESRSGKNGESPEIVPGRQPAISFGQESLWYLGQLEGRSALYHMPATFEVKGPLSIESLRQAMVALVARHSSLRTVFPSELGKPRVQMLDVYDPLQFADLSSSSSEECRVQAGRMSGEHASTPFNLANGPLLRLLCLRFDPEHHWLLFNMHHIISDGWSLGVLARQLGELYSEALQKREISLQPLRFQYSDYAAWQRETLSGEMLEQKLAWWQNRLEGAPPVLNLPADNPGRSVRVTAAVHIRSSSKPT